MLDAILREMPTIRKVRSPLTPEHLAPLDPRCQVVQFNSVLTETDYRRLGVFMESYPDVTLRAYGHGVFRDVDFLQWFPHLRSVQVNEWLLENTDGFSALSPGLEFFGWGQTNTKRHSLSFLAPYKGLKEVYLEGQAKDIEVLSTLIRLEKVNLRSITLPDLSILTPLRSLWWLTLKLGGTKNLAHVPAFQHLKYQEIWLVRGMSDLSPLSDAASLQYLFLESLAQIHRLPPLARLMNLRRLQLETLKNLEDLAAVAEAPKLDELYVHAAPLLQPHHFECLKAHPILKGAFISLGSRKKSDAALEATGLPPLRYSKTGFAFS